MLISNTDIKDCGDMVVISTKVPSRLFQFVEEFRNDNGLRTRQSRN